MIYSHTLVRNGQPFIEQILRNAEPYMDKMLVTVSENSTDGSMDVLRRLQSELKGKMVIDTEKVSKCSQLTQERQKQLDKTPMGSWVLFLDDDDWWPKESMEQIKPYLDLDVDGLSVNPYQLTGVNSYDIGWNKKYFTKFFKKQEGVHYEGDWPRDLIFKNTQMLYWKKYPTRVPIIHVRFFHLSYIKNYSFRTEDWAKEYAFELGNVAPLPDSELEEAKRIFSYVRRNK